MKSDYCDWGTCSAQQHCCGKNVCCAENDFDTLLLIAVILGTLLIVTLCCGCLYYKSRQVRAHIMMLRKYMGINYTRIIVDSGSESNSTKGEIAVSTECIVQIDKTKLAL